MTALKNIIDYEFDKFLEIVKNDEIIKKQAKNNSFEDFKKSNRLRDLFKEWTVAMYEKYAVNGKNHYGDEFSKSVCEAVGESFLFL